MTNGDLLGNHAEFKERRTSYWVAVIHEELLSLFQPKECTSLVLFFDQVEYVTYVCSYAYASNSFVHCHIMFGFGGSAGIMNPQLMG